MRSGGITGRRTGYGSLMSLDEFSDQTWTSWGAAGLIVLSALSIVALVVVLIRVVGLRSLSKMSSFDFAVTVAIGSIIASVTASSASIAEGGIAIGALLGTQALVSTLRRRTNFQSIVDNTPQMLFREGRFDTEAMRRCRVTRNDVIAKLREANVLRIDDVRAVILETTGDISVLHGDGPVDHILLDDVLDEVR